MSLSLKKYTFPLFALFVIFSDELFHGFFVLSGSALGSGLKAYMAVFIAGVTYYLLVKDVLTKKINKRSGLLFFSLLILLVLYYLTHFLYPEGPMYHDYRAHLLLYGSMCIPAGYVGIRLSKRFYDNEILVLLPFFIIFISLVIGIAQLYIIKDGSILDGEDAVLNYQQASYYFAYCFSYAVFYLYFYRQVNKSAFDKFVKITTALIIPICVLGCISSGGRGGFVYLGFIVLFLFYRIAKQNRKARIKLFGGIILGLIAIRVIFNYLDISDSQGFLRIFESRTDAGRFDIQIIAWNVFKESPLIGKGLGSIWWTVGFYSHNIFTDLLAETGIVGTIIILVLLIKQFFILNKRSFVSSFDFFILLIFLGVGIQSLFSGYWFAMPKLFLVFGYVFGASTKNVRKTIMIQ